MTTKGMPNAPEQTEVKIHIMQGSLLRSPGKSTNQSGSRKSVQQECVQTSTNCGGRSRK